MTDLLTYDEQKAFTLMDDASTVNRIVRTTPVERLREKRFGDWNAVQVIGHLVDVAEVFAERVRRAVEEGTPLLRSIDAGSGADPEEDPMALARRLLASHQRVVALLQSPGAAERPAVHSEWGRVTAGHIGAYLADHSSEHMAELGPAFPPGG